MFRRQSLRHAYAAIVIVPCLLSASACAQDKEDFNSQSDLIGEDVRWLAGKDVDWVGSPPAIIEKLLDLANVTAKDYVIDLGSGDGRIVIMAAKRGATAQGIEYNPELVELSKRNAAKGGVADKATFVQGDIFKSDFSQATVLTLWMGNWLNIRLRTTILKMKPGTRVTSHTLHMGAWKPDKKIRPRYCWPRHECRALLWVVPAKVQGHWKIGDGVLSLEQKFQRFSGTWKNYNKTYRVRDGRLKGQEIHFKIRDRKFIGRVDGPSMSGSFKSGSRSFSWRAARIPEPESSHKVGSTFKDCNVCPEMVVVPAGTFVMGSPKTEKGRSENEGPQRKVTFAQPFAVSKFEVTFSEWDACVANKGCSHEPSDQGWGRGPRPVVDISWNHAQEYIDWISRKTGEKYRLLTEAEWEYAARAGTKTTFSWGNEVGKNNANCRDCEWDEWGWKTSQVGAFEPNAFGLYDMHGNVAEWVHDPWHDTYRGAPKDGTAWMKTNEDYFRILRGGSWAENAARAAYRIQGVKDDRYDLFGFRVARGIEP